MRKTIAIGCVAFILVLSLVLGAVDYQTFRSALYERDRTYITNLLHVVASQVDIDDLGRCAETGVKSPAYEELQRFMDEVKDNSDIHFMYIVKPLNASGYDNMQNLIAAFSAEEKATIPEQFVQLNSLTGDAYPPEVAQQYLDAAKAAPNITFFEDETQWGVDYTGALPLVDSAGSCVGLLCIDIDVTDIKAETRDYLLATLAIILLISSIASGVFIVWTSRNIVLPIKRLEKSVAGFAYTRRDIEGGELKGIQDPNIHTNNEVESLSRAVVKMSEDMLGYVRHIVDAESRARAMGELANKDSLTQVHNRTAYDAHVQVLDADIASGDTDFAIVVADLNNLKRVNDTWGHECGNDYIRSACRILCDVYVHSPVFRIGGDEFVVALKGRDFEDREKLYREVEERFALARTDESEEPWNRPDASVGMAVYDPSSDTGAEEVFVRADRIMYENKEKMKAARSEECR